MSDRFSRIGLKSFVISSKTSNLSLSMTSNAFVYHAPLNSTTPDDLSSLIQSKQLWLLPRGLCRLDVYVQLPGCDAPVEEPIELLEFIAETICQSSLWSQLGLAIRLLDIQYHSEENNFPSLYFSIEQPDMSSALLSPPHAYTAQFKGLECVLRFKQLSHSTAGSRGTEHADSETQSASSPIDASTGAPTGYSTFYPSDLTKRWEAAAYLVEAALQVTLGLRQRIQGLSISKLEEAPSLLSLAPAIWNSHYSKCTASHAKYFDVVSEILASSVNGQSPELRRKGARLFKDSPPDVDDGLNQETRPVGPLESCIRQRLWDLLQATLKPTMGTGGGFGTTTSSRIGLGRQSYGIEIDEAVVDQAGTDQNRLSYENHYPCGNSLPLLSQGHDEYHTNANHVSDLEYGWLGGDGDLSPGFQDNELYEAPESYDAMDLVYSEAWLSDSQLPQPHNLQRRPDLYNMSHDYDMLNWFYDGDTYDCNYSYVDVTIQGSTDSELAALNMRD
ncbi:hypothetical protein F4861DRAFT_538068 [Xylaria intraflava]|nr:hypothetical protein F4861DRAFT_538068 [Xylaria intraflava]